MLQFYVGGAGFSLAGSVTATSATGTPALVADRPMSGTVAATGGVEGNLRNVPQLSGTVTASATVGTAELITPLEDSGEDDYRRRSKQNDEWEFRGRKAEQTS